MQRVSVSDGATFQKRGLFKRVKNWEKKKKYVSSLDHQKRWRTYKTQQCKHEIQKKWSLIDASLLVNTRLTRISQLSSIKSLTQTDRFSATIQLRITTHCSCSDLFYRALPQAATQEAWLVGRRPSSDPSTMAPSAAVVVSPCERPAWHWASKNREV